MPVRILPRLPMHRITQCLSVGRFASAEQAAGLLAAGVTHVLNVSRGPSGVATGEGSFRGVEWVPIGDDRRIPEADLLHALDTLHRMAAEPGSHVYVHCVYGQQRSPTVLWLYLVACGLNPDDARDLIESRCRHATAGHPRLVGPDAVYTAQMHGLAHFFPLPRGEVIVPFGSEPPA